MKRCRERVFEGIVGWLMGVVGVLLCWMELLEVVADRVRYYNHRRRHASLDNRRPIEYLKNKGKPVKKT